MYLTAGVISLAAFLTVVTFGIDIVKFDVVVGVLTLLVLVLISIPLLQWVVRTERQKELLHIFMWAMVAKVVFTLIRYFVLTVIYNDNGDAGVYTSGGAVLMDLFRKGQFVMVPPGFERRGPETARIAVVVGLIYTITGVSRYAASFVFTWICFSGQILMYRALRRGVPEADSKRYAILVFFLPSLLFWPSAVGKEALMVGGIGLVCYGAAQILGTRVSAVGILTFLAGAAGLFFIRPHMALIAIVSLGLASLVGSAGQKDQASSTRAFVIRITVLVVLVGAAVLATTQLATVLGGDDASQTGLTAVLDKTKDQTSEGGSVFDPPAVTGPQQLPAAIATVLFRPFPWEAHSVNSVIAASEGLLLGGLFIAGRRRLLTWSRMLLKRPYLVFCLAFSMTFIVAFSYIGNFGILARQRTQMLPLILTMLALPAAPKLTRKMSRRPSDGSDDEGVGVGDEPGVLDGLDHDERGIDVAGTRVPPLQRPDRLPREVT